MYENPTKSKIIFDVKANVKDKIASWEISSKDSCLLQNEKMQDSLLENRIESYKIASTYQIFYQYGTLSESKKLQRSFDVNLCKKLEYYWR